MVKQGRASSSGPNDRKREPISKAVNVAGVAQLGEMVGTRRAVETLYQGKGYRAPMGGQQVHRSGSQGRHR